MPHSKLAGSMTLSFHQFRLINTSAEIDVDWYWWWKIHDVKYSIPRASISVPSLVARSNPALVTHCCFCKLPVSFCLPLYLFFFSTSLFPLTYLSLPERLHVAAAGERHSVKVPHQKPAAAVRYHACYFVRSCHGRLGPWTMLYLVWTDGQSGEGEAPGVVLDNVLAMLSE